MFSGRIAQCYKMVSYLAPWCERMRLRLLVLLGTALLTATSVMAGSDIAERPGIRLGVLAYRGEAQARRDWQGHADYLTQRLQRPVELRPLGYQAIDEAVASHEIDLLITNTGHYTELESTGEVARIATRLIAGPKGPLSQFGGTAIARIERSDIAHYRDLKGKRVMIPDTSSLGGWQVHLREALAQGVDLEHDCSELLSTENHEKVVAGVLEGRADVGLVRSDLIESMIARGQLTAGKLKIVDERKDAGYPFQHSTRLYPEWPFASIAGFPEGLRKEVLIALLELRPDDPAARSAGIYGWTLSQNYQSVLDLFREARLGPYARQAITWADIVARYGHWITALWVGALLVLLTIIHWIARTNRRLRQNEASLRLAAGVFENAGEAILITDASGRIVDVNNSACRLTGYPHDELIGQTPRLLRSGHHDATFYQLLWQALQRDGIWRGEIWNRRKDGTVYAQQTSISSIRDQNARISHFISISSDITGIKQSHEALERMAYYDALTGLPNRLLLADRLAQAIGQARRRGDLLAVCYLDLDNFKPVNDRWGHKAGDRLLVEIAGRLTACVRQSDTVSRLGGDEFVILLGELGGYSECEQALMRISEAVSLPVKLSEGEAIVSASIGVTVYPTDGSDPDTLLRQADQAMYAAKQAGRHRYLLFGQQTDGVHHEQLSELQGALARQEFLLHYQPRVDLRTGRILGMEALVRWQHPLHGLLLPERFLFRIEQAGLHVELGEYVIDRAVSDLAAWVAEGRTWNVAINIDALHLQCAGFAGRFAERLKHHPALTASMFELEIPESAALRDLPHVAERIGECRRLGLQIAIDHFGTGYSSLASLKQLPVQALKIDRSFIGRILEDPDDLAIVDGAIGLAAAFRQRTVAVGIETEAHGVMLLRLGCDWGQGQAIAPPMPASEAGVWSNRWQLPDSWRQTERWPIEDLGLLMIEIDHLRWIEQLERRLLGEPGDNLPLPPLDPTECRFGHWLQSEGIERYRQLPAFPDLLLQHERIHALGNELAHRHAVVPEEARRRLSELHAERDRLLERLAGVRRQALAPRP